MTCKVSLYNVLLADTPANLFALTDEPLRHCLADPYSLRL